MSRSQVEREEYRCCIVSENSGGLLRVGRKTHKICVVDTSRTGFGIRVPNAVSKKIKDKSKLLLIFGGETWEVALKSRYSEDSQYVNLGLTRVRDLTKITCPRSWGWSLLRNPAAQTDPTFLAFLVLAFLTAVITLPGIGDSLGTAPKVREVIESVVE
jgi:hypothetical protein